MLARISTAAGLLCAVVALASSPAEAQRRCAGANADPAKVGAAVVDRATLCLVNRFRRSHGLKPVRANKKLRRAATRHSRDMVRHGYFDHVAPSGETMMARATKVRYLRMNTSWMLSENIAYGDGGRATANAIVRQWIRSAPHRANMLDRYVRDAGVGVALGAPTGGPGATYTMNLGRTG